MKSLVILLLTLVNGSIYGCTCFEDNKHSPQDLVFSSFAFEGTIIATSNVVTKQSGSMTRAFFRVTNWLTPRFGADTISAYTFEECGLGFSTGQSWLLFASPFMGRLTSSYCDRSILKDNRQETIELVRYFNDLANGTHNVDIELKVYSGLYRLIGRLEQGDPVGHWVKLRGLDTLAFYNFIDGSQIGMQMETDEEVSPPERHYYELGKKGQDTIVYTLYDKHVRPIVVCEYQNGPFRIRYQAPYWDGRFNIASNFKVIKCKEEDQPRK